MIPVHCRVQTDQEAGTHGDCLRACVASVLDMQPEDVPHFMHDACDGETGLRRLTDWLAQYNLGTFRAYYPGDASVDDILLQNSVFNPEAVYLLFGMTASGGGHVVVCRGGAIDHDPAWSRSPLVKPSMTVDGEPVWMVLTICRI